MAVTWFLATFIMVHHCAGQQSWI